jgi:hypothetical protein
VGDSGTGKTVFMKRFFGEAPQVQWRDDDAVISHFDSPDDASRRLMSVGLNAVPTWLKPYKVLSNGEKFRATLARQIGDGATIDNYTGITNRTVAASTSTSLARLIRRYGAAGQASKGGGAGGEAVGFRRVVLATSYPDIIPYLSPGVPESPLANQDNLKKRLGFGDFNSPALSREATDRTAHINAENTVDDATVAPLNTVRNKQERQGEITAASGSEKGRMSTDIGHLFSEAGSEARETACGSEVAPSSTKKRRLIVSADGQENDGQAEPNQAGDDVSHAAHSTSPKRKADDLEAEALECEEKSPSKKICTRNSDTGAEEAGATQGPDSDSTSVKSVDAPSVVLAECSVHPSAVASTASEVRPKPPAIALTWLSNVNASFAIALTHARKLSLTISA